jgi:hypothetical protein
LLAIRYLVIRDHFVLTQLVQDCRSPVLSLASKKLEAKADSQWRTMWRRQVDDLILNDLYHMALDMRKKSNKIPQVSTGDHSATAGCKA